MAHSRLCSIKDCRKPLGRQGGHGWCQKHYARWRKHGDPLVTVQASHDELVRFYRDVVLNHDGDECLIWPYSRSSSGYARWRNQNVSRVLCEEINGPAPTPTHEAAHSCGKGDEACVTKRHLSWKTPAGNQMDRIEHGTSNRGERQGRSKLTEADVRSIRLFPDLGPCELAARFGVTHANIIAIRLGKSWAWLE